MEVYVVFFITPNGRTVYIKADQLIVDKIGSVVVLSGKSGNVKEKLRNIFVETVRLRQCWELKCWERRIK